MCSPGDAWLLQTHAMAWRLAQRLAQAAERSPDADVALQGALTRAGQYATWLETELHIAVEHEPALEV